jgi:hypothetical protein
VALRLLEVWNLPEKWMLLLTAAGGMLCPELIKKRKNGCSAQKRTFI